jgi:hypothetical protein
LVSQKVGTALAGLIANFPDNQVISIIIQHTHYRFIDFDIIDGG